MSEAEISNKPEEVADPFRRKLEERRAAQETQAVPMEFAGFPCKVIPLPWGVFVLSGRMPEYLTLMVLSDPSEASSQKRELTNEEVREGEAFKCSVVCRVVVSPRIVAEGIPGPGEYLYADLMETAPEFVGGVFRWVMRGCPLPKKESEGKGETLTAEALENFPSKRRQSKRAGTRANGKARRKKAVRTNAAD